MRLPTIDILLNEWTAIHGFPVWDGIRIGPGRCGIGRCMKMHAYAVTVESKGEIPRGRTEPWPSTFYWTLERPCDGHWTGRYGMEEP